MFKFLVQARCCNNGYQLKNALHVSVFTLPRTSFFTRKFYAYVTSNANCTCVKSNLLFRSCRSVKETGISPSKNCIIKTSNKVPKFRTWFGRGRPQGSSQGQQRLRRGGCVSFAGHWCLWLGLKLPSVAASSATLDSATLEGFRPTGLGAGPPATHQQNIVFSFFWFLWESIRISLRALRLSLTFVPLLCLYPFTCLLHSLRPTWWRLLLLAVESAGPVYIKFGQWASTRRDLFSQEFCDQFSRLQRSVKPHSWYFTCKRLDTAFGKDWRRLLVKFDNDRKPIGSGCVAQVYQARLRADLLPARQSYGGVVVERVSSSWSRLKQRCLEGLEQMGIWKLVGSRDRHLDIAFTEYTEFRKESLASERTSETVKDSSESFDDSGDSNLVPVAVKVLHPGIHTAFRRDLFIITTTVNVIQAIVPGLHWLNLSKCVEEFATVMKKQIDLSTEASNLEVFADNFRNVPSVVFPRPIHPLVTEHVLVETFEVGEPMLLFTATDRYSDDLKDRLANIGIDAVLKMVFRDNFVHGDLHPGNILVQNADKHDQQASKLRMTDLMDTVILDVKRPPPLRLVFLDCGITASLAGKNVHNLLSVFTAVTAGDGEEVANLFLKHTKEHQCQDPDGFRSDMTKIVKEFDQAQKNREGINVSSVITQLFSTLIKHKVQLEGNFAMVILSMMIIEGLGHSLNPNLDLMERARPVLMAKRKEEFKEAHSPF